MRYKTFDGVRISVSGIRTSPMKRLQLKLRRANWSKVLHGAVDTFSVFTVLAIPFAFGFMFAIKLKYV